MEPFRLETISELHPLATNVFVPFAVARLQQHREDIKSELTIELRGIEAETAVEQQLQLVWEKESIPELPLAVPENSVTEWAALGVACAVIWHFAGLRLHAVAAVGDGFDYWVRKLDQEFGLEISGTQTDDLETRHREKVQQLRANPYGSDGYVVVVGFATRRVIFSIHRFEESPS